jgi:hypothetical protein
MLERVFLKSQENEWFLQVSKNRFLQAGKGAENTKEKSRQCFPYKR